MFLLSSAMHSTDCAATRYLSVYLQIWAIQMALLLLLLNAETYHQTFLTVE